MKINCAYFTHPGKVRSVNQDGLFLNGKKISEDNFDSPIVETHHIQNVGLYSVVDGARGHSAGETASRTTLTEFGAVDK